MRLSAGWRATPGFTIRCFRLFIWPISGHAGSAGARRRQTPGVSGSRPARAGAAGHAPTIRLAAGPNLGRLSRAHDIGGFGFPPPRRRNCAHRACPAACAAARDSQLDGAAFRPGLVTPRRPSHPPEGHGRSSSLAGDRADLASGRCDIGATWPSAHPPCPAGQTRRWPSSAGTDLVGDREVAALEGPAAARGVPTG